MATLERPLPASFVTPSTETSLPFDPIAVPQPPQELAPAHWQQVESEDLIHLGQEQLFSGARTRHQPAPAMNAPSATTPPLLQEPLRVASTPSTPLVSEELYGSLGAAKHAFAFTLNGLLRSYLLEESPYLSSTRNLPSQSPFSTASWPSVLPLRRHSIATTSLSLPANTSTEPDALLSTLVRDLRLRFQPISAATSSDMRSIGPSPLLPLPTVRQENALEEIQARLDVITNILPPIDAELAHSLVSLLSCIERLLAIARVAPGQSLPVPVAFDSSNVYLSLERQARALQTAREDAESVVGAAREVEIAERDLLWGRVDDLSERVRTLCRQRADAVTSEPDAAMGSTSESLSAYDWSSPTSGTSELVEDTYDLPRYSTDASYLPPAYFLDHVSPDEKTGLEKPPLSPELASQLPSLNSPPPVLWTRRRQMSNVSSEKMQRDLDSVSAAIERLYIVSPQLANQRVEPDRRQLRERQLAKLGNAIERLSKGRFEDQRATPTPIVPEEAAEKARRIRRLHEAALETLIQQIDKAASRTLSDQRVEMKGGKQKNRAIDQTAFADSLEAQRREYILENTGKGRLASQDAIFTASRPASPSVPVTITEFFRAEVEATRPRSNSTPRPIVKKRFSGLFQAKPDEEIPGLPIPISSSSSNFNKKSLRLGVFKKGSSPMSSRRGSYDSRFEGLAASSGLAASGMSRQSSAGLEIHTISPLDYIAEESRNLGTIVVTFWPRVASSAKETWEVVLVDGDSIVVAPTKGGLGSRLALPSRVIPQSASVINNGTYFEVKLAIVPPSPTRARPDLEVHAPLSTSELRDALPSAFGCATCHAELVDSSSIVKYNALPSEHWAELLDAWMCHGDQRLSDDLIAKGKGIKPRENEGLVGSLYILFPELLTKNWIVPERSQSTRSEADDVLVPAYCFNCNSLVGQHVTSLSPAPAPTFFRLLKYAAYPVSSLGSPTDPPRKDVPRYSLASHLTAEMLEIGQAHACHRFVVKDLETETPRVLLWFFNPAIRVSFLSNSSLATLLEQDSTGQNPFEDLTHRLVQRSLNAVKVFYSIVASETDNNCHDFMSSSQTIPENIYYPLPITTQLIEVLQASSSIYPVGKRNWGNMDAGFLERL